MFLDGIALEHNLLLDLFNVQTWEMIVHGTDNAKIELAAGNNQNSVRWKNHPHLSGVAFLGAKGEGLHKP